MNEDCCDKRPATHLMPPFQNEASENTFYVKYKRGEQALIITVHDHLGKNPYYVEQSEGKDSAKKRLLFKVIAIILIVACVFSVKAMAVEPRASDYLFGYGAYIYRAGWGKIQAWFEYKKYP